MKKLRDFKRWRNTMKKTRDYRGEITMGQADRIIDYATSKGYVVDVFEGCLLDNAIIYDAEALLINRRRPRKFLIIKRFIEIAGRHLWRSYRPTIKK